MAICPSAMGSETGDEDSGEVSSLEGGDGSFEVDASFSTLPSCDDTSVFDVDGSSCPEASADPPLFFFLKKFIETIVDR